MADAPPSLEKVRKACKNRGATGAKGLSRAFRIYDDDGSKTLNRDEFFTGLQDYGVTLTAEEAEELWAYFDRDGAGGINIDEFILAFRKPLSGSRLAIVKKAFEKADRTGDGVINCKDLKGVYNCREHPKYKNGEMTEMEVFQEFLKNFEPDQGKDGQFLVCPVAINKALQTGFVCRGDFSRGHVTEKEFCEYYACLGAGIDNDAYFDLMVRNAWKI